MCGTLNIILLIGAKMRALRLPLRALQQARQFASRDDAMTEKTALAMSVLRRMQLAILLGNMSMVAGFLATISPLGIILYFCFSKTQENTKHVFFIIKVLRGSIGNGAWLLSRQHPDDHGERLCVDPRRDGERN